MRGILAREVRVMSWIMQILVGRKLKYDRAIFSHEVLEPGEWVTVTRPAVGVEVDPPIAYAGRQDAELMLDRLYPELPADCKRTVEMK
jgi:hypothetical protein